MLRSLKMIFIIVGMLAGAFAQAQIDDASRTLLIEKLDRVYLNLAPKDPSKVAVTLRLADLYAEKARIDANQELNSGCTNCVAGEADRKKALKLYLEVLDRTPEANQGKVMVQIGHLYQLTGAEANAMNFYQKILQNQAIAPQVKAEAQLSIAEIYFKRRDFANAKNYYNQVLSNSAAESKGLAAYRIAWCSFNVGHIETAISEIEMVLKTPALLSRGGAGQQVDTQFHEEVSRDYATFLSKTKMEAGQIENLYKLSPESTRIQNVQSLASDAERLGNKQEALKAWTYIYQYLSQPEDRLSAQIAMAQLQFDLGNKTAALENFSNGLQLSRDLRSCGTSQCDELRRRSRQFVVNWNQLEKNAPSADLLTAYGQYLASYPEDADIAIYAAQAARSQKNFARAMELNEKAAGLLAKDPQNAKKLETVLLTQLEIAEEAKDKAMIAGSLSLYLAQSQLKTKEFEVRYQQARGLYEDGQYATASEALRGLALTQTGEAAIRKQAAELSLDALVLMKDETKIGLWATEYAAMGFAKAGSGENDFAQIAQKSVLTKSAELAKAGNNQGAYEVLLKFQPANAAFEDQVKYHKNRIILAESLKKYPEALAATDDLLHLPKVSKEDVEFAWSRKAVIAELTLDFATALAATEKLTAMPTEEKTLKLAIFAELAGRSSETFYTQYLKVAKDEENKQLVAAELVRKSKTPEKDIESLKPYLAKAPHLVAQLYSEAFARNSSAAILQKVAKDEKLKNTSSGKLMSRVSFLQQFADFKTKITSQKLATQNQQKLASSIRSRAAMLDKLEAMTKTAIQSGDWTTQLVSIDLLGKESERFYQELISAPMPEGLSQEDEGEYLNLLSAQAAPFQTKASAAKVKVEQFWQDAQWLPALQSSWVQKSVRNLVAVELKALTEIAPQNVQAELAKVRAETETVAEIKGPKPSLQEIETARRNVYLDPMNAVALKALQGLEDRADNTAMVQYLQTRVEQLGQGVQK